MTWGVDPIAGPGVVVVAWLLASGATRLRGRDHRASVLTRWQLACAWTGLGAVAAAVIGPVEALAATSLAAHMTQHLLLTLVAAPLLALAAPGTAIFAGLPRSVRSVVAGRLPPHPVRRLAASRWAPIIAVAAHLVVLWGWHVPVAYDAAVANPVIHGLEHATFLGTAVWVWSVSVQRIGATRRPRPGGAVALFATGTLSVGLGMGLVIAPDALYASYATTLNPLAPAVDQQIAGGLMMTAGGLVHATGGAVLIAWWLRADDRDDLPAIPDVPTAS